MEIKIKKIIKYIASAAVLFFACRLFLPRNFDNMSFDDIRNKWLLLAIVLLVLVLLVCHIIKICVFYFKVRSLLSKKRIMIKKFRFFWRYGYIVGEDRKKTYIVRLALRKRKYYKYYFDSENKLQFFKTTMMAVKTGISRASIANGTLTRLIDEVTLPVPRLEKKNTCNYFVINKFPTEIKDSRHGAIFSGDLICDSDIRLYDLEDFQKLMK